MANDFSIACIEAKNYMHSIAIPALNRKRIRTPACVTSECHNFSVVSTIGLSAISLEQKSVQLHDSVNPFVVYGRFFKGC